MQIEMSGPVLHWRGPSPYHFVAVPEEQAALIASVAPAISYGWGVVPVTVALGGTRFATSLFPKDGGYLVPLKDAVRAAEQVEVGDEVVLTLTLDV